MSIKAIKPSTLGYGMRIYSPITINSLFIGKVITFTVDILEVSGNARLLFIIDGEYSASVSAGMGTISLSTSVPETDEIACNVLLNNSSTEEYLIFDNFNVSIQ